MRSRPPRSRSEKKAALGDATARELFRHEYLKQEDATWNGLLGMPPRMVVGVLRASDRADTRQFAQRIQQWSERLLAALDERTLKDAWA
jgi:hypothetical protein